ncbi:hypothetical protein CFB89_30615 [Burkholderia sp. AU16741]|nr:hypothetical protein CFB89_30615 [Burkholderia sp. AU16741]
MYRASRGFIACGLVTTTLPAASRRGHLPTAVSPSPLHGSASRARCRLHECHHARRAAPRRASSPHAAVFAYASASRSAARRDDARPSFPHRSSVVGSKL